MRKFIFIFALFSAFVCAANAQIATENSNALDNIGVGITAGAATPLDFNSVFPLNTNVGLKVTKDFTPTFGLQLEGLAFLNDNHFNDLKTAVKATNVGLNGVINLTNLVKGYNGTPRTLELGLVAGLGWLHTWDTSVNNLSAKTGFDVSLNLGKTKAHSFVLTPAVYWNLNKFNCIQFDKRGSQLALNLTYVYHLKTSNGTRHFKTYDVGALCAKIDYLQGKLDECESRPEKVKIVEKVVTVAPKTDAVVKKDNAKWIVAFDTNSKVLTDEAIFVLNQIGTNSVVDIEATASPSGTAEYNQKLSEERAKAVADYLTNKGVKVNSAVGKGVDAVRGRAAVVTEK